MTHYYRFTSNSPRTRGVAIRTGILLLMIGLLIAAQQYGFSHKGAIDWQLTFYPAAHILLQGGNPYEVGNLFNPVWVLFPILPFALLGPQLGQIAWFAFGTLLIGMTAFYLRASWRSMLLLIFSPMVLYTLLMGNVEALTFLGLVLPAPLALFFLVLKPQLGLIPAAYIAYRSYREGGIRKLTVTFAPVTLALLLNFAVYGNWFASTSFNPIYQRWNVSLFPYSIPVGIALAYYAFRRGKLNTAAAASPFISPYVAMSSWSFPLLLFTENDLLMLIASVASWIPLLLIMPH